MSPDLELLWPMMVVKASKYGARWRERGPGKVQERILERRLKDGYTPDELLACIDGYVRRNRWRDDWAVHCAVTTIYRPTKIDANLAASMAVEHDAYEKPAKPSYQAPVLIEDPSRPGVFHPVRRSTH